MRTIPRAHFPALADTTDGPGDNDQSSIPPPPPPIPAQPPQDLGAHGAYRPPRREPTFTHPQPVLPPVPPARGDRSALLIGCIVGIVVCVVLVFVLLILAAILLPALARAREAARRASCQNNLKQFGIVCKMWESEHRGVWPDLAPGANFAVDWSQIYPEYLTDPNVLVCLSDPSANVMNITQGQTTESYVYLGYAFLNDTELQTFMDLQGSFSESPEGDIPVEPGRGTGGGDTILKLREGIENEIAQRTGQSAFAIQSQIPVAMDNCPYHIPAGVNVLYMDGHVEFVRLPGKFPGTSVALSLINGLPPTTSLPDLMELAGD